RLRPSARSAGLFRHHHRDPVDYRVGAPALRAHDPACVEADIAVVDGTDEEVEELGIDHVRPSITSRTSDTSSSTDAASGASTLSRSSGSVLEGRRLNHRSGQETVRPSRRSWSASEKWDATASMAAAWSSTRKLISPDAT